uniref:Calmodulin regulated spectrin-associated protein family, member 3 n=1 Tax=Knipowitschia caucasica TaxID=637954 RepID=A0AAV2KEU9_KNICA
MHVLVWWSHEMIKTKNVPVELRDPFYCDQYEQEHLKPPVTRLLQSSELYCRTYGLITAANQAEPQPKDNVALLKLCAQRGMACGDQRVPVTDTDLRHKPIKMSAHLSLIDVLMSVAAMETLAVVKSCGNVETQSSWETTVLRWVNKINQKLRDITGEEDSDTSQSITESQAVQPSLRYRKDKVQSRQKPVFPVVNDVSDLSSGCAIVAVIHYYCPDLLRLEDVCMKESMSVADSVYNLQFILEFCDSCLKSCCHLTLEDVLYIPQELQVNVLSFLAELLHWFEVQRPDFVQPIDTIDGSTSVKSNSVISTSPSIFKKPFLPISASATGSLTQSTSMSHIEGVGKTWNKKSLGRPLSAVSFSIPFGLDSDVDVVMGNPVITRSVSSDQLNPGVQTRVPYTPPEEIAPVHNKAVGHNGPQRASWVTQALNIPKVAEENGLDVNEAGEVPTIEEALQIIHNESKMEQRLHPDGAPDGFYLHSPDDPASSRYSNSSPPVSSSAPSRSGMIFRPKDPKRTRNASECSRDDDSVLRDGSVDSDASEDLPKILSTPAAPGDAPRSNEASDSGVKMTSFAELLNPPQNVDRIPHLRRVNPAHSQVQTSSAFSIGDAESLDDLRSFGPTPVPTPALTPSSSPHPPHAEDGLSEAGSADYQSVFSMDFDARPSPLPKDRLTGGGCSSGAPSECSFESDAPAAGINGKGSSLIEISLSALGGDGEEEVPAADGLPDSVSEQTESELRGGVGFFFKETKERTEDEMAQRKAALLEKQQKRAEEMKRRKLEQEKEKESNKPQWMIIEGWGNKDEQAQTPGTPPTSHTPPAEGTPQRRGDFTRQEYERRHQLKIMEDLDKVLRQKPTTVRGVKKQRPKTVFRDDSVLSNSPAKGLMGTKLSKVYSHSSMNLSSMANDSGGLTVRKSPSRSHSPARHRSPGRRGSQNDWENGSNISSPASIPEYTGPKLYKEPSFKSNKFIIHNAITRCCLAGKVNEPQKNKIVEEMEKSAANHFLILFRDSSCQFRAIYTMNPETEEMERLTGIGPRIIFPDMVESIFKYSSDRKQFTAIPSKTMSMSVDAITIPGHFWQKRPGTPKKLGTPK